jgi:uncharacterized protein YjbJ (UPF0337 family)
MDKNHIEGIGHVVKGAMKESLGKIIGDAKLASDGSAERASGKEQYAAGADGLVGVDGDRIAGIGHQIKGALKEGLGNITGNPKLEAEGIAERGAGKAQNAAGGARDTARDALKDEQTASDTPEQPGATRATPEHPERPG